MKKFDQLSKVVLNEAPLSSYVKSAGSAASKLINPAAYARGAGSLMRGAGKAANLFTTSSNYLAGSLNKIGNAATGVGGALSKTGQWLKDPSYAGKEKASTQKTQMQQKSQKMPSDLSKTKTQFIINNRTVLAKYAGNTKAGYPMYVIKGVPWAKSVVLELKDKNLVNVYMYADRDPNIKKPPAVVRPGTINYSGVQNNIVITTK